MTAAMQNINAILTQVSMTERDTLGVTSNSNCVYRLLTVFQCLLLFPCFGIRNAWHNQVDGTLASLIKARKSVTVDTCTVRPHVTDIKNSNHTTS